MAELRSRQLPDTQRKVYRWTAIMTGSLLAIASLAVLRPFQATEERRSSGPLYFDAPALDFSEEPCFAGDRIRHSTALVNVSNADIKVEDILKSCTCVTARLAGEDLVKGLVIPARTRRVIDIEVVAPPKPGPDAQALTIMYGNPPQYATLEIFANVWIPLSAQPHRLSLRAHEQHDPSLSGLTEAHVTLFDSSELPAPSVKSISTSHAALNAELLNDLELTTNHIPYTVARHRVCVSISEHALVSSREEFVFIDISREMPNGEIRTEKLTIPVTLWSSPSAVVAFPNALTILNATSEDTITRTIFFDGARAPPELSSDIPDVHIDIKSTVTTNGVECRLTFHAKGGNASGSLHFQFAHRPIEIPLTIRFSPVCQ
jgi:hypothetical protein